MGASMTCCSEIASEERIEAVMESEKGVPSFEAVGKTQQATPLASKPAVNGEDMLPGVFIPSTSIPRCSSYYGVAVVPPPATPRCQSFVYGEAPTQTGPSETTTRLPSLPEDEIHIAPEPCKWDPVFLGLMLMHLEKAEDLAYGEAFDNLTGEHSESLPLDSRELHDFLMANTILTPEALEPALHAVTLGDDGRLEQAGFLELLREHALGQEVRETWFDNALKLGTAPGGKELTRESCLEGLRIFATHEAQRRLPKTALDEQQLERICTCATKESSEEISFTEWALYCNKVARTISLARYASLGNDF